MKVNVLLVTYKQENYIKQTVESILMQKTDFEFNVIVADDCSPDATEQVIERCAQYSKINFVFLPKTTNLGFVKNYQRGYAACDAQYIALMEGDDYWTSPDHLQRHVDFLDTHPDFSMSYNRHTRVFEDQARSEVPEWTVDGDYEAITMEQQILTNRIGNLSCCVFRNEFIKGMNPRVFEMIFADWLLGMIMAQKGPLAYQKEVTSAYRIHDNGQWSRMSEEEQHIEMIRLLDLYNEFFDHQYTDTFTRRKKSIEAVLYGDKSFRGRVKNMMPESIKKLYRKL